MKSRLSFVSLAVAGLALSGCVVVPPRHHVAPVPQPYVEVVPAMPYAGAVWIAGYWNWSGGRRYWVPGRWEHPHHGGGHHGHWRGH